jgi:hypothetical protein
MMEMKDDEEEDEDERRSKRTMEGGRMPGNDLSPHPFIHSFPYSLITSIRFGWFALVCL